MQRLDLEALCILIRFYTHSFLYTHFYDVIPPYFRQPNKKSARDKDSIFFVCNSLKFQKKKNILRKFP